MGSGCVLTDLLSDADIHIWYCSVVEHLGREAFRNQHQSREGDGGRSPMHECPQSFGEEVPFSPLFGSNTDHGSRWHSAGRLWDILYELVSVGDLPLPQASPNPSNKRERDSDSPLSADLSNTNAPPPVEGSRIIAGSRRVSGAKRAMQQQTAMQERPVQSRNEFQLPIHTHDLGKIPLHPIAEYPAGPGPSPMDQQGQAGQPNQDQPLQRHWVDPAAFGYLNVPIIAPTVPPMPAGGMPANLDNTGASLFSIDPLIYDDMMNNFGSDLYASAIASGSGGQTFGNLLGTGFGLSSLSQGQPGTQSQTQQQQQQQQVNQMMMMNMAGNEALTNPDALAMWTNTPNGFEWAPF